MKSNLVGTSLSPSIVPDVSLLTVESKASLTEDTSDRNNTCLTESLHSNVLVFPLVSAACDESSGVDLVNRTHPSQLLDRLTFTGYHENYLF